MFPVLKTFYARLEMHYFSDYQALHSGMQSVKWDRFHVLDGSVKLLPSGMYVSTAYSNTQDAQASIERAVLLLAPNYGEEILLIEPASVSSFNLRNTVGALRARFLMRLRSDMVKPPAPRADSIGALLAGTPQPESTHDALVRLLSGTPKR